MNGESYQLSKDSKRQRTRSHAPNHTGLPRRFAGSAAPTSTRPQGGSEYAQPPPQIPQTKASATQGLVYFSSARVVWFYSALDKFGQRIEWTWTLALIYRKLPAIIQMLNQVFLNHFVNSAQAIHGEGRITVRTRSDADDVHITIADNGVGMTDEQKKHLASLTTHQSRWRSDWPGLVDVPGDRRKQARRIDLF